MKSIRTTCLSSLFFLSAYGQEMIITTPIVSLRTAPVAYVFGTEHDEQVSRDLFGPSYELFMQKLPAAYRDPLQDSEVLFNELVTCLEKGPDGWLKIKLSEQYGYKDGDKKTFVPLQGYIQQDQARPVVRHHRPTHIVNKLWTTIRLSDGTSTRVPMGTKLHCSDGRSDKIFLADERSGTIVMQDLYPLNKRVERQEFFRQAIVTYATQLIGAPYCWGGRGPDASDCSGLINLAYRTTGLEISRNAHSMWLQSTKIDKWNQLQPADLIFLAHKDTPDHVCHVLMYIDNETVIESCVTNGVSLQKAADRFGQPVATLKYGTIIKALRTPSTKYVIYFGSYLCDKKQIQQLRNYALNNYDLIELGTNENTR